ncbi:hypothetical protein L249_4262 [Ophiocordyceps polyrhachis-furcata BCC 54312]|uniref:Uncharacterized protein n=1 Tax=Ophiocordyceps polyrhachis-furcata BCC 54312 TaxID=1330021 RepID=A0A367L859_9HYPO|nr:hypothetical protein L249_4262 [Ophiocordyceps polyrhachis-furcata BCC 54312]
MPNIRGLRGASRGSPSRTPLGPGYACPYPGCARSSPARANSDKELANNDDDNYEPSPGAGGPYGGHGLGDP